MRTLISFLVGLVTAVVVVGLGVLVAQNGQDAQLSVLGTPVQAVQGWIVAGAAALGFLLAFLILIPGRLASAWQTWTLGRQAQELGERLQALREQHAELAGRHQHLLAEHQHVLAQVLPKGATRHARTPSVPAAASAASDADTRTMPATPVAPAIRQPAPRTRLVHQEDTPLDQLRARITAIRVAIAAKLADLKRRSTAGSTSARSDQDQERLPQGPTAAAS